MESNSKTITIASLLFGLSVIFYGVNQQSRVLSRILTTFTLGEGYENFKVVKTQSGKLEGFLSYSRDGRPYWEFRGIPYASPPLNHLRFADPIPPVSWDDVRSALHFGPKCVQFDMFIEFRAGNEDCLFVNVYTPNVGGRREKSRAAELLPVIVVVHGGHFMYGSAEEYRPDYFMDENVVIVTFNYRLGSLGFLSTGDAVVPGNFGLKDQVMALKWVKNNIQNFGGNPEKVSLLGHSAGSAAVHMHMFSKESKGLFRSVIAMSGTSLAPWALKKNPWSQAERLGHQLNCPTNSSQDLLNCLRSVDSYALAQVHSEVADIVGDRRTLYSPWVETVKTGSEFFSESPQDSIANGRLENSVPLLTGVNSDEGLIFVVGIKSSKPPVESKFLKGWKKYFPRLLYFEDLPEEISVDLSQKAKDYFLGNKTTVGSAVIEISRMISTIYFFEPLRRSVAFHTQHHPVYLYHYEYAGSSGFYQLFDAMTGVVYRLIDWPLSLSIRWLNSYLKFWNQPFYGACHGDENLLLFKIPLLSFDVQKSDIPMSKDLVKTWVTFATNGNPGPFKDIQWPPAKPNDTLGSDYMIFGANAELRSGEPFRELADFWTREISKARFSHQRILNSESVNTFMSNSTCQGQVQGQGQGQEPCLSGSVPISNTSA